jgi:Spy/CpxP family protein refolding chaperone
MKLTSRMIIAVATVAICLVCIAAKPLKPASPPATPFFKTTGEPFELEKPFPGVTAALMLSDEQKSALSQAHQETVRNPKIRNKISALEVKKQPDPAEREAIRKEMDEARLELRQRVDAILTPQQKELVNKIQDAATEAEHEANEFFDPEFREAKGEENLRDVREKARVEAEDILVQKLEKFLTPAQMQAIQQAATEQRARKEQQARNAKTPEK